MKLLDGRRAVLPDQTKSDSFTEFVVDVESRLRQALGPDLGREAAAEALAYGWEHWDRISEMENPVEYLFRVGQKIGAPDEVAKPGGEASGRRPLAPGRVA